MLPLQPFRLEEAAGHGGDQRRVECGEAGELDTDFLGHNFLLRDLAYVLSAMLTRACSRLKCVDEGSGSRTWRIERWEGSGSFESTARAQHQIIRSYGSDDLQSHRQSRLRQPAWNRCRRLCGQVEGIAEGRPVAPCRAPVARAWHEVADLECR